MTLGILAVGTLVLTLILAAVPNVAWLMAYAIGKAFGVHTAYAPFGWTALFLSVLCVLTMAYGAFIGRWKFKVTEVETTNDFIPQSFDGYRIVHISDLHLSTFDDNKKKLDRIVDMIDGLDADLVCFTGDLVTTGVREAVPYTENLKRISAKDGVVSVLGNHDFLIYSREFSSGRERESAVDSLAFYERETLGWNLLRNESVTVTRDPDTITIVGVDNSNCSGQGFRTINRADLSKALTGTGGFRILLSHDPSLWEAEVLDRTDIQLTLSGHTHAAQIRILGWTPASWMFRQTDGRYDRDGQTLYVNIGLGCTAPVRIGANPEITVITLRCKE